MALTLEEAADRREAITKFIEETWGPIQVSPTLCGFPDCTNRRKLNRKRSRKGHKKHRFCDAHHRQMTRGGIQALRPLGSLQSQQVRSVNRLSDAGYPIRDDLEPGKCCVEWCTRKTASPRGVVCERHSHKITIGEARLRRLEKLEQHGVKVEAQFIGEICAITGCGKHLTSCRLTFCEEHYSEYGPKARIFSRKETRPTDGGERVGH